MATPEIVEWRRAWGQGRRGLAEQGRGREADEGV